MRDVLIKFRGVILFIMDIVVGFLALCITLIIKYGSENFSPQFETHFGPFLIVIGLFLLNLYIFNLYLSRFNRNLAEFSSSFLKAILFAFTLSILIFYLFGGFFNLTPKSNLIIFSILFSGVDFYLRIILKRYYVRKRINKKIYFVGNQESNLIQEIKNNENIGYIIRKESSVFDYEDILETKPDLVIMDAVPDNAFEKLYSLLKADIPIYTINMFYEETFQKIPIETIDKANVIQYVNNNQALFTFFKRILDISMALFFLIILSPLFVLIAVVIKLTSRGPVLYKQIRVTLNDSLFTMYKFRSMYLNSEQNGAIWTRDNKTDTRITPFGKFLRKTHLDEMPQLINILQGDISFVGPRPERPEFTKVLNEKILYYDLRHSTKPGLTGWAQINYKYGASLEDAQEKLKYDFYYIKNKNLFFDFLIIIKTIATILQKR